MGASCPIKVDASATINDDTLDGARIELRKDAIQYPTVAERRGRNGPRRRHRARQRRRVLAAQGRTSLVGSRVVSPGRRVPRVQRPRFPVRFFHFWKFSG